MIPEREALQRKEAAVVEVFQEVQETQILSGFDYDAIEKRKERFLALTSLCFPFFYLVFHGFEK